MFGKNIDMKNHRRFKGTAPRDDAADSKDTTPAARSY